jgi:HEAT repeat protein
MRRYLALVLGRTRDPEAVPLLLEALADADSQTRIYALLALGAGGDPRAAPAVSAALADADPGIRKTAAYALGELGGAGAAAALAPVLADPVPDVRWNAALALARLGGAAGAPVLRQMLDRSLTAQVPGITPAQQEEAMVSAVAALAAVDREGSAELLTRLAAEDPSLKVRQAALAALAP